MKVPLLPPVGVRILIGFDDQAAVHDMKMAVRKENDQPTFRQEPTKQANCAVWVGLRAWEDGSPMEEMADDVYVLAKACGGYVLKVRFTKGILN